MNTTTMTDTQKQIYIAEQYLKMNDEQRKLLLTVMELLNEKPERSEFAMNWKGKVKDLPAALAQI